MGNDAKNLKGDCTKIIDLEGRSIVPGFIDAHLHMGVLGINLLSIDCRYPYVKSIEDIKEKIRENAGAISMDIVKNLAVKFAEGFIFHS